MKDTYRGDAITSADRSGRFVPRLDFRFPCPNCGYTYITVPAPDCLWQKSKCSQIYTNNWSCKGCLKTFWFPYNILVEYENCVYGNLPIREKPVYEIYSDYRRRVYGDSASHDAIVKFNQKNHA